MKLAALALVTTLGLAGVASAEGPRARRPMHQLLLERFDANHDGRLEPRERKRAARVLRKLAHKLATQDRRRHDHARRFERQGDGVVGPGELPRAPQPLDDRDGGWLDDRDQP